MPNEDRIAEMMAKLKNASQAEALANVTKIHASLCTLTDDDTPKLQEHYFISHFLDYFTGEKKLSDNPEVMPTWLAIAGSPITEVGIVDDNELDKILFRVPGIYDTSLVDPLKDSEQPSLARIFSAHAVESNHIKPVADRVLLGRLLNKADEHTAEIDNSKEARWLEIFARYGKKPILGGEGKPETTEETVKGGFAGDEDDLIYD